MKKVPIEWKYAKRQELLKLYESILENKPRNVINLMEEPKISKLHMAFHLYPIGFRIHIHNVMELHSTIKGILNGLGFLHSLGYVHRDLRWPNIIQDCTGNVRLIDLEHGGLEGKPEYVLDTWRLKNGLYTKEVDLDMILIYYLMMEKDKNALDFMSRLQKGGTVDGGLSHPWLSN